MSVSSLAMSVSAQIQFDPPQTYFGPQNPIQPLAFPNPTMPVVDLNADAHPDVVLKYEAGSNVGVQILFNTGHGKLSAPFTLPVPGLEYVIAADMNGDSLTDLVVSTNRPEVDVLYNMGDGRHYGQSTLNIDDFFSRAIDARDLNGDGRKDILLAPGRYTTRIAALMNDGGVGHFTLQLLYEDPHRRWTSMAAVDVDGDGDIDVVGIYATIRRQSGRNGWEYRTDDSELVLLDNDGSGVFSPTAHWELPWSGGTTYVPTWLTTGDFDGDGDADFAIAAESSINTRGESFVYRNDGPGVPLVSTQHLDEHGPIWSADFDLDGRVDLAVLSAARVVTLQNTGAETFGPATAFHPFEPALFIETVGFADIYGDGKWDAAVFTEGSIKGAMLFVYHNVSVVDALTLFVSTLQQGQTVTLRVEGAQPGEHVYFCYSREGAGNELGQPLLGGLVLDLRRPISILAEAVADGDGHAEVSRVVPLDAPLTTVVFQAVARRGEQGGDSVKSAFLARRIESN